MNTAVYERLSEVLNEYVTGNDFASLNWPTSMV
jgi:hypothetical protein